MPTLFCTSLQRCRVGEVLLASGGLVTVSASGYPWQCLSGFLPGGGAMQGVQLHVVVGYLCRKLVEFETICSHAPLLACSISAPALSASAAKCLQSEGSVRMQKGNVAKLTARKLPV